MVSTVTWDDGVVVMVDQRRLPGEQVLLRCHDHHEVAAAIRDMAIRGAPAIGVAAALGLALGVSRTRAEGPALAAEWTDMCSTLAATRPTAVNLFWAIERMRRRFDATAAQGGDLLRSALLVEALAILQGGPRRLPAHGRPRGGAPAAAGARAHPLQRGSARHRRLRHGARRRPLRGTSRQARGRLRGRDAALAAGSAAHGVGADAGRHRRDADHGRRGRAPDGARRDQRGGGGRGSHRRETATSPTRSAPTRSRSWRRSTACPFYVAAPVSTLDLNTPSGEDIPIEERPAHEVTHLAGQRIAPEGMRARNPAFDVTPHRYVTAIVCERGVARPPYAESLPRLIPK